MTTRTWNGSVNTTWGATPGGANNNWTAAFTPDSTTDAVINGAAPANVVAPGGGAPCKTLTCTGFTHDLSGEIWPYGNVILAATMTASSFTIRYFASGSLTSAGIIPDAVYTDGVVTLTFADNLTVDQSFKSNAASTIAFGTKILTLKDGVDGSDGFYLFAGTTVTWSSGAAIHYSLVDGNTTYLTDQTGTQILPPLVVAKIGGSGTGVLTMNGASKHQSITLTSGVINFNGSSITAVGNISLNGGSVSDLIGSTIIVGGVFTATVDLVGTDEWFLNVTGAVHIYGKTITNCTSTNAMTVYGCVDGGGNSANITFAPWSRTLSDWRVNGCRDVVVSASNRISISCPETSQITVLNTSTFGYAGSVSMTKHPGALCYMASKLFTITSDGYVIRFTNADIPVQDAISSRLYSATDTWLVACSSILIAPGVVGQLVSLSSAAVILNRLDTSLSWIACAVANGSYVYCFDGRGGGCVVSVNTSTGEMREVSTFIAQDCQGVLRGCIQSTNLVIAVLQLDAVVVFSLAIATAPTQTSRTQYPGFTLKSVLADVGHSPITKEYRSGLGVVPWWPIEHGIVISGGNIFLHRDHSRVTLVT